ncbi:MAG: hypothetical protein ACJ74H_15980 [Thermoanaerobaculia bacterium]
MKLRGVARLAERDQSCGSKGGHRIAVELSIGCHHLQIMLQGLAYQTCGQMDRGDKEGAEEDATAKARRMEGSRRRAAHAGYVNTHPPEKAAVVFRVDVSQALPTLTQHSRTLRSILLEWLRRRGGKARIIGDVPEKGVRIEQQPHSPSKS